MRPDRDPPSAATAALRCAGRYDSNCASARAYVSASPETDTATSSQHSLALGANVPRHPPDRGVVEQERFDNALQDVDQIVVPADVRQLMQQERFQLRGRQTAERPYRDQHHGAQPADHGGHLHQARRPAAARDGSGQSGRRDFLRVCCHSGGAGRTSTDRMRAAIAQPPARRTQNTSAPASQTMTTHGRNRAGWTPDTAARTDAGSVAAGASATPEAAGGVLRMR